MFCIFLSSNQSEKQQVNSKFYVILRVKENYPDVSKFFT